MDCLSKKSKLHAMPIRMFEPPQRATFEPILLGRVSAAKRCTASANGFTLIELMVTMAILAILATVAIPNFVPFIESSKHKQVVSDLNSSIAFARSEAVKRGVPVVLAAKSGSANGLSRGWRIFVDDSAAPGVFSAGTQLLHDQPPYDSSVTIGLGSIVGSTELLTFSSTGGNVLSSGASNNNRVVIQTGASGRGTICLALGGRSRYLDKNIASNACD
jgi:type IV fimbrial biogenesis protein FimT